MSMSRRRSTSSSPPIRAATSTAAACASTTSTRGEGEPVVMVHGNPTWSFYYRELVEALRGSYRTIVPDHIGCGLSDKPDDVALRVHAREPGRRPRGAARPPRASTAD